MDYFIALSSKLFDLKSLKSHFFIEIQNRRKIFFYFNGFHIFRIPHHLIDRFGPILDTLTESRNRFTLTKKIFNFF